MKGSKYENLSTHLHIAEALHKDFEGHINKFLFKVGNILPDLWLPLRLRSHYEYGSGEFVNNKIKELIYNPRDIWDRSLQLGIIAHFVTDFSCAVHKPEGACSFSEHMEYETMLTECHETGHEDIDEAIDRAGAIIYRVIEETVPLVNMA